MPTRQAATTTGVRTALVVRALACATAGTLALAACSGSDEAPSSARTTDRATGAAAVAPVAVSPMQTGAPVAAATGAPWKRLPLREVRPGRSVHSGAVLASSTARTQDEKTAVTRYLAFWRYLVAAGDAAKADDAALARVAALGASNNVRTYVDGLQRRHRRSVGWVSVNVTDVRLGPAGVIVRACVDNGTFDVDRRTGRTVEKGAAAYDAQGALQHDSSGRLVVTYSLLTDRTTRCSGAKA